MGTQPRGIGRWQPGGDLAPSRYYGWVRENGARGLPARALQELRDALLVLHKALLESERSVYERDIQPIASPQHMLALLMEDPWFEYLRELSRLVVKIDECIDARIPATQEDVVQLVREARQLMIPSESGSGFERRYFEAIQRDPNVVLTHSEVVKRINLLELPADG